MSDPEAPRKLRRAAWRLAGWQMALTVVVAIAAAGLGTRHGGWSALAGGSIGTLAGLYQALRLFGRNAAADPAGFMRAVYVGEFMKVIITAALFVMAIRLMKPQFLPMMAAYAATFLAYWVALGTGFPWLGDRFGVPAAGSNWKDTESRACQKQRTTP